MNINLISSKYKIRQLNIDNMDEIYEVCISNPKYYEYVPPMVSKETILDDLKALPPGKDYNDKYFLGIYNDNELIGVMDLILGYPKDDISFIGFFMLKKKYQNNNIGSFIINELVDYIKSLGYKEIRLGYVENNIPAKKFWYKNGFRTTSLKSKEELYTVIVLRRILSSTFDIALNTDLKNINELYKMVLNTKYCVWNQYYPTMENIIEDYNSNDLFVLKFDNEIVGAISIVPINEMDDFDEWKIKNSCEIARVVIKPEYQNGRISYYLLDSIIQIVKNRGYDGIHISVQIDNIPALKLYEKLGFTIVGKKNMYDNEYYICELNVKNPE